MDNVQVKEERDIESRLKEAEVYHSMGLLNESLNIYKEIVSAKPELESRDLEEIKGKITRLKEEIKNSEQKYAKTLSSEDMPIIKQALSVQENIPEILDSAAALKELGLFKEAAAEYEKLFKLNYPSAKIIPELMECLTEIHSPSKAIEEIEKIINRQALNNPDKAQIKFLVGLEMEKIGRRDLARDLYKAASFMDPTNKEIKNKFHSITAGRTPNSKYDYLLNRKLVTHEQLQKAWIISKKTKRSVESILIEHFKVNKEELGKSLSSFYNCPFRDFDPELPIPVELIRDLKKSFLLHYSWIPLSWGKEGVEVLIDDPLDIIKTDQIRALIKSKKIILCVGIKEDIEQYIRYFFEGRRPEANIEDLVEDFDALPDIYFDEEEEAEKGVEEVDEASSQVVRLVDQVLVTAYRKNASDIHIEPSPISKRTNIRFRIDGVCQDYIQVPNTMVRGIVSRLKIMAGLDISERRLPQDGKIKFKRKGIPHFELRLATLPTAGNFEDAVLRILPKSGAMGLDEMEIGERDLKILKNIITQPYGLVLVVGPTGSGKTTTLHAILYYINKPGVKIWTAEDPIEITQAGLRQVEVKPKIGLTFARLMRAFLRADPDIIMIGELRDQETAAIGIEASLTGHLVFSTLHTNSAPKTITRLLDMGINPLNFSDALLGVLAQRLVRRLCTDCREGYHPSEEEFEEIANEYGRERFEATGIKFTPELTLYRPKGCEKCSGTGYKGRVGIYELMNGSNEIKNLIKKQGTTEDIFEQAVKEGLTTLKQDGIQKVFRGLTDIREVRRVCIA